MPVPQLLAVLLAAPPFAPPSVLGPPLPDQAPIHLGISLKVTHVTELNALRKAQLDPSSPQYHHWITPQEFGQRFGQSAEVYAQVSTWLTGAGFEVSASPNRTYIEGTGTAAAVTKLLSVHLMSVVGQGTGVHAPDRAPTYPKALEGVILHVSGLDTRTHFHHHLTDSAGDQILGPQDLRAEYGVQALLDQGYVGQGQQLVVLSTAEAPGSEVSVADVQYFFSNVSDAKTPFLERVLPNPGGDFDQQADGRLEYELDAEMQSVGSPGADSITLEVPPSSEVFTTGPNDIVNNLPGVTAVSVSLGTCEAAEEQQSGESATFEQAVIQGTMEGQTWSAASGDNGADDCMGAVGNVATVDFPSDVPEVVAMGGSEIANIQFDSHVALTAYQQEVVWNEQGGAAGGGSSTLFGTPAYQNGYVVPGSGRSVPDVSLIAGPPSVANDSSVPGQIEPVEGTSVASPLSAGFFALIASRVGCRLGDPHATLYALGGAQQDGGAVVYHDIVTGNNSLDGITGPSAKVGYDSASGWGSLNVAAIAAAWTPCGVTLDGGSLGDAGTPEAPYDACTYIACGDGGSCITLPEGPSGCVVTCNAANAASCGSGEICSSQSLFASGTGVCIPGCLQASDCGDGGTAACDLCTNTCVAAGDANAKVGDACTSAAQCPTSGNCETFMGLFTDGYCSLTCDPSAQVAACVCPSGSECASEGNGGGLCLETCPAPGHGCTRSGYVCQPQPTGSSACLPACQVFTQGNQTFDDCQIFGNGLACDTVSGVCGGPVAFDAGMVGAPDAGQDAGLDAGPDSGVILDAGTIVDGGNPAPDGGGDAGINVLKSSGCGCTAGAGGADGLFGILAVAGLLSRRRRRSAQP